MRWNDVGGGGAVIKLSPILPPGFKFIIDKEKEKKWQPQWFKLTFGKITNGAKSKSFAGLSDLIASQILSEYKW